MKNILFPFLVLGCLTSFTDSKADLATIPTGYVTISIAAGTGTNKVITPISVPLLDSSTASGQLQGHITGLTASTISNSGAGWTPGQLSTASTPQLIRITSGAAVGYTFLISTSTANTGTSLTIDMIDASQVDLTTLGIATGTNGDTYQIIPCDTLSSLFGTPATTGVQGGTSAANSDNIIINNNGTLMTYFYDTAVTPSRWTRSTVGNPDASNTPLRPDAGINYCRLAANPLTLVVMGQVPSTDRKVIIRNSGLTYLAQGWPADTTLAASVINTIPNWVSSPTAANADTIQIMVSGGYRTYWFDGTSWRRQTIGSPISDSQVIPLGTSIIINKIGTSLGISTLSQIKIYSLN